MKNPLLLAGSMLFLLFIEFVPAPVAAQSPTGPVAEIYLPSSDFDSVFVGSAQWPACVSIRNMGTEDLICEISTDPAFPMENTGTPIVIPPGEELNPCVSFKPLVPGFASGTIRITTNDPQASEVTSIVTGTGLEPPIPDTLLTHTLQAGTIATGQLVITNTTVGRALVSLYAYSYNLPETFVTFSQDAFYLNPGQALPVSVYFNATELVPGFYDDTFLIISVQPGDGDYLPLEIPVTMTVEPDPNDPTPYGPIVGRPYGMGYKNFDSTFVHTLTQPRCFGFTNTGDEPLLYFIESVNPEFTVTTTDTITLLPGESASECVWYSPTKAGSATGLITITTNDINHPHLYFYNKGFAYEAPLNITRITDTVHIGDVATHSFQIKNTTPHKAHFHLQEDPVDDFLKFPVRTFTLDPGDSTTAAVVFDFSGPGYIDVESWGTFNALGTITVDYDPLFGWDEAESIVLTVDITLLGDALIHIPESLQIETSVSSLDQEVFNIGNTGGKPLTYSITTDAPVATGIRTYHTGFEDFQPGTIHGHHGWYAADYVFYHNDNHWKVDTSNPFSGSHHLRCTTDGEYITSLYSPPALETGGDLSTIDMMIDVHPGARWTIAANERLALIISADGSLSATSDVISENAQPVNVSLPEGYFHLQFSSRSSTHEYFIKLNGQTIFSGTDTWLGFIHQVAFSGGEQPTGSFLDIDDIVFTRGEEEITLLSFDPVFGTVSELDSQPITVYTDTRNILPGEYSSTISIENNSWPAIATINVTTVVKENTAPVLSGPSHMEMVSGDTLIVTYTATDVDDSFVSVEGLNFVGENANWMEVISSGNGFITCKVVTFESPIDSRQIGMIKASDARGGISSIIFDIHILAHRANDFALTYFKTGEDEAVFTDTIVVDIAHPDLNQLTIQFKPDPNLAEGEGVKFILDGVLTNIDRKKPYYINSWLLPNLSEGMHNLTAESFYTWEGTDYALSTRKVIIQVINSAAITDFDVVNSNGVKLMDLENGSIIDLSKPGYGSINIVANTSIPTVRSVRFLGSTNITARIDNRAPYALKGNADGSDTFWNATPGDYTYTAIPYMQYYGWGPKGIPLTVSFKVIRSTTNTTARISDEEEETLTVESTANTWSVYPIPVNDDLTLQLDESVRGTINVQIINVQGINFYSRSGAVETFQNQAISTVQLGMNPGIYFVILQHQDGKRSVKKILKE